MERVNFIGLQESTLGKLFDEWEVETYRLHQVFNWIYNHRVQSFDAMTNLSKSLRSRLQENFHITLPRIERKTLSQDGSIKYLFGLEDDTTVESVWMPSGARKTLCLSTQVGAGRASRRSPIPPSASCSRTARSIPVTSSKA